MTQRCNLNCSYCHREGEHSSSVEMSPEEICRIVAVALELGIQNIKLTGGEPTVRNDIVDIVSRIGKLSGLRDFSMTTNGTLLKKYAEALHSAGLMRVNVSLPTLNRTKYRALTGGDVKDVIEGVKAAVKAGLYPVKLNMVILKGFNDGELLDMIDFARSTGAILQLIELEPVNIDESYYRKYHKELDSFESYLKAEAKDVKLRPHMNNRRIYILDGVNVEVVKPIENTEFCMHCTRIRLTSDGKLKPCLMRNDNLIDLLTPLRKGVDAEGLKEIFIRAIKMREPFFKKRD